MGAPQRCNGKICQPDVNLSDTGFALAWHDYGRGQKSYFLALGRFRSKDARTTLTNRSRSQDNATDRAVKQPKNQIGRTHDSKPYEYRLERRFLETKLEGFQLHGRGPQVHQACRKNRMELETLRATPMPSQAQPPMLAIPSGGLVEEDFN